MQRAAAPEETALVGGMTDGHDSHDDRAPICPYCGVTALPADTSNVIDTEFVCENPDCEAYGDRV
jgi:hypothetical protein